MVGLNKFQTDEKVSIKTFKSDPKTAERQIARLEKVRAERNGAIVQAALGEVRNAAEREENLVLPILKAVKAHATVGEIFDILREIFGDYRPATII